VVNPYACFDSLSICRRLQHNLGNAAVAEVYLFAYLSCLLSLFKQHPASSWQYRFSITQDGYPYSADLDNAIKTLMGGILLEADEYQYVRLTKEGNDIYESLASLEQNSQREPFIEGACSTILAMPVGLIRRSLSSEPEIRGALELSQSRVLLSTAGLDSLHGQFNELSAVIGIDTKELMVPAMVWLEYLAESRSAV